VGEGLLVEGLEDDLDLLVERFTVGIGVVHRRPGGLHLARVIPALEMNDSCCSAGIPVSLEA
jgi:hypothetical protein